MMALTSDSPTSPDRILTGVVFLEGNNLMGAGKSSESKRGYEKSQNRKRGGGEMKNAVTPEQNNSGTKKKKIPKTVFSAPGYSAPGYSAGLLV